MGGVQVFLTFRTPPLVKPMLGLGPIILLFLWFVSL